MVGLLISLHCVPMALVSIFYQGRESEILEPRLFHIKEKQFLNRGEL